MNESTYLASAGSVHGLRGLAQKFCEDILIQLKKKPLRYHVAKADETFRHQKKISHFHPENELVLQCCGTSLWELTDGVIEVPANHIVLLPRGVPHKEYRKVCDGRSCNINLYVMSHAIGFHSHIKPIKKGLASGPGNVRGLIKSNYSQIIVDLLDEITRQPFEQQFESILISRIFETILGFVRKAFINSENAYDYSHVTSMCIQEVLSHVCEPQLNVAWLANRVNRSSDYISNTFKKDMGVKLTDYINEQRVFLGKKLLNTTSLDIGEIARSCGYLDPNYFGRVFKKMTAVTPREYRTEKSLL